MNESEEKPSLVREALWFQNALRVGKRETWFFNPKHLHNLPPTFVFEFAKAKFVERRPNWSSELKENRE